VVAVLKDKVEPGKEKIKVLQQRLDQKTTDIRNTKQTVRRSKTKIIQLKKQLADAKEEVSLSLPQPRVFCFL
jgi:chromosome segregation ATPase